MGGTEDKSNLVLLTAREHYLAHYLLTKIYKNFKVLNAFLGMNFKVGLDSMCSRRYAYFIEQLRLKRSERSLKYYSDPKNRELASGYWTEEKRRKAGESSKAFYSIFKNRQAQAAIWTLEKRKALSSAWTPEMRLKQASKVSGFNRRFVRCMETGISYPSLSVASRSTGVSLSGLSQCVNKHRITAGGFHWSFEDCL